MNKFKEWLMPLAIALTCLVALFSYKQANAADLSVYLGGASYHIGEAQYTYKGVTRDFNQANYMVGLQYKQMMMFGMKNSYHRTSIGTAWTPEYKVNDWFGIGVRLGITSGYRDTPERALVLPIVNPYVDFSWDSYHTQIGFLPSFGDVKGVVTLNFKYDLF